MQSSTNLLAETIASVSPLNAAAMSEAASYQDTLAMPPESMGELLAIGRRLS